MGDTQPRTFKLSPSALLSLPRRLCNPPPSVGRVGSFAATPIVNVTLDDVLDRKHLPPLGLKDFEEWLLFVEQNAENLYFILWLKEYNARYSQWINNTRVLHKSDSPHPYQSSSRFPLTTKTNSSLAIFYSRAKQTFFTPNSLYELDLPSDILGPFHAPSLSSDSLNLSPILDSSVSAGVFSPHPDPAVFIQVEDQVRSMLQESLNRFASSTISNVGTSRATCGLVGGAVIALAGLIPPTAENFALSRNRWLRLLALPGLWLGLTVILASLRGVCMMIYIFGDLRQLRSFELVRPSISSPQRLRPLRNNPTPACPPPLESYLIPITRPPIIPKPIHDPEKALPSAPTNPVRFLTPIPEPTSSPPSPPSPPKPGLRIDTTKPRVALASVRSGSVTSRNSSASRTSTTSSDEVDIHISEAFYDVEPPYLSDGLIASSPVPSSWQGESPSHSPSAWIPPYGSCNTDSAQPASPADHVFRTSNPRTSATSDREDEKWMPTARFIRPFEYDEWEEWDCESAMYTTDESLGGYGGGDEESRVSQFARPSSLSRDGPRTIGARVPARFRAGCKRGTTASSKTSEAMATFDFDALPPLQAAPSHNTVPTLQRRPRYRACDASSPPPLHDEASPTEAGRKEGILATWFVEFPKSLIRKTQGKCEATKQVMKDVLTRSAHDESRRNDGGDGNGGAYRDAPETDGKQRPPTVGEMYQVNAPAAPHSHYAVTEGKERETFDINPVKENWRVRWRRVLSVPAFKSPLTKILSPVVTRAQWEVVIRSGIFSFVISLVVVAVLVALPVP